MISSLLRVLAAIVSLLFIWFVLIMVRKDKFLLKYAFLWLLLGVLGILAAIFPEWVFILSKLCGFETPANFLFFVCVIVLMTVTFLLCVAISRQTKRITNLVQTLSILLAMREEWASGSPSKSEERNDGPIRS